MDRCRAESRRNRDFKANYDVARNHPRGERARMELPDSISDYLKAYSAELSDQILKSFPPLYSPEETPSPVLTEPYRKPFKAQEIAVMSSVRRVERARTAAIIGEMGTGKTFMAISAVHCEAAGRPYACLVMAPGTLLEKWSREVLETIPGARV
jgi:SNF2 family DNA or RNA helicase